MAKKDAESKRGEVAVKSGAAPSNAIQDQKLQKWLETVVAILLGLTTLVSAWASWIGSLHSGIQSINFPKSNNMASRGTAEYNMGMQLYLADYMSWNTLKDFQYELEAAQESGDKAKIELISNSYRWPFSHENASESCCRYSFSAVSTLFLTANANLSTFATNAANPRWRARGGK